METKKRKTKEEARKEKIKLFCLKVRKLSKTDISEDNFLKLFGDKLSTIFTMRNENIDKITEKMFNLNLNDNEKNN